ncbi:MAG: DUF3617 domain-containing protein [Proteobacteria bacterium]|nr:DUF3617 domain-containing protein [Pseudomonadota bacterium]
MRLASLICITALGLGLGACNKASEQTAGANKAADAVAAADKPQPGKYRATTKVTAVNIPGMDPANADRMKAMLGSTARSTEYCLTKAQADKGFEEMTRRAGEGACTFDNFTAQGGRIDGKMTCKGRAGQAATLEMHGTYSGTGSQIAIKSDMAAASGPVQAVHIESEIKTERLGDCS